MKINFKQFRLKDGIGIDDFHMANVQMELATVLYDKGTGLACHALAMKIYNSEDGLVDLSRREYVTLLAFSEDMMTPKFIDSLRAYDTETDERDR